ncbi:hypothetical protein DRZ78_04565 [Candidatus Aerophobetes bacterium]|uniref:Uncharacterized protein n=1 Tax=Aerophobetes bacterium TaxID=2030807 RepID=A0A662D2R8_UNCAE|nr:MAG: hypothetical protein DRZ78_04565 [Candidatus Aerophobetes bacterium]
MEKESQVRAMVLAAGLGTRLKPLTYRVSKPMVPVINKPSILYPLRLLKKYGIDEVIINLHYQAEQVKEYLGGGEKFGLKIIYSEEKHLLGTAGGVKKMEEYFTDTFLVLSADGISNIDLGRVVRFHREREAMATVVLKEKEERFNYGIALCDEGGRITRFMEKPSWGEFFSNKINTGIYVFDPKVFSYIPPGQEYDFGHQVLPEMVKAEEKVYGYVTNDYWMDMGNLEDYRKTQRDILEGKMKIKINGQEVRKGIWIGENSKISPLAVIESPSVIGNNCQIEEKAKIGKFTTLGSRVIIKKKASLKECILWNNIVVGEGAQLDNCILTDFAHIPANFFMSGGIVMGERKE